MFYGFSEERSQFFRTVKMYLGGVDGCAYQLRKLLHVSHQKLNIWDQFTILQLKTPQFKKFWGAPKKPVKNWNKNTLSLLLIWQLPKKAYSIIWQDPETYKNVFIRLGTFHTICSLFKKKSNERQYYPKFSKVNFAKGASGSGNSTYRGQSM